MDVFEFEKDYILENEQTLLRPLESNDLNNLISFSLNEPDLWKYSLLRPDGEENFKNYIQLALDGRKNLKEYPFIVFDKRMQQYAGCTRFYDIQLANKNLQLGYTWYGKSFQGTGLNKHCKFLLLEFAFEKMEIERVEFRADNNNKRSIAAMKSIGCITEGVLRKNSPTPDGERRDSIVLSILKEEWENHVKNELRKRLKL